MLDSRVVITWNAGMQCLTLHRWDFASWEISHKINGISYSLFSIANPLFFRISAIVTTVAIAVTILPNNVSKINTSTYRKGETLEEWKLSFSRNAYFFKDNIYTSSIDRFFLIFLKDLVDKVLIGFYSYSFSSLDQKWFVWWYEG